MYPRGEADGKPVNIPAPVYTAMGGRRSVRLATRRNTWLKCVDVDPVGKSAGELRHDSILMTSVIGNKAPSKLPRKASKLQVYRARTANRHRWSRRVS